MVSWELTKFKVEKTNKSTLNFETEIVIPEIYKDITVIYDDKQLIVWGSELKQDYVTTYEIKLLILDSTKTRPLWLVVSLGCSCKCLLRFTALFIRLKRSSGILGASPFSSRTCVMLLPSMGLTRGTPNWSLNMRPIWLGV